MFNSVSRLAVDRFVVPSVSSAKVTTGKKKEAIVANIIFFIVVMFLSVITIVKN
jgi:hypothetical protein